jgi:hypothetical protein
MQAHVIHFALLAFCYCYMLRPSKGHLQGVRLLHFHSQINKMCVRFNILEVKTYLKLDFKLSPCSKC